MTDIRRSLSEFASAHPDEFARGLFSFSHLSVIHIDNTDIAEENYDLYGAKYYVRSDDYLYFDESASDLNTDAILRDAEWLLGDRDISDLYAAIVEAGAAD